MNYNPNKAGFWMIFVLKSIVWSIQSGTLGLSRVVQLWQICIAGERGSMGSTGGCEASLEVAFVGDFLLKKIS